MLVLLENFDLTVYIFYTLITSAVIYILVALAVKVFCITDPRLRAWLFMLPLLLPVTGYLFLCPLPGQGCSQGDLLWFQVEQLFCRLRGRLSPYWGLFFLIIFALGCLRVGIRLLNYHFLIRRCKLVAPGEAPELEQMVSKLATEAGLSCPRLFWSQGNPYPVCFTFGFREAKIAISRELLQNLTREEIKAVLAHEMGHLAGRDHFLGWLLVVCRDLMAFNPFGYISYRSFLWEREQACDDYARELTQQPLVLAQCLVKLGRLMRQRGTVGFGQPGVAILGKQRGGLLTRRVERLVLPGSSETFWWQDILPVILTAGIILLQAAVC
ncbi:MAG: M48 family metalloprotease [bacterium]|jgi:Zn-dependent protease with chaperone function